MILSARGSQPIEDGLRRGGEIDCAELLVVAEAAANAAASLLCNATIRKEDVYQHKGRGIVTALDLAAERCIRESILSRRPADEVLGEELGPTPGQSGVAWVIDPIDGTNNFVAGLPHWAISIAAQVHGRTEAAIVCVPLTDCRYTALAGVGAWRNGLRLPLRTATHDLGEAVVATGFAAGAEQRERQLRQMAHVLGEVRDIRCHGAASIELCNVAAGELDAYYESDLRLWDVAAGALIASEAGIDVSGSPWSGKGALVAAPPPLADSLRSLVGLTVSSIDEMR